MIRWSLHAAEQFENTSNPRNSRLVETRVIWTWYIWYFVQWFSPTSPTVPRQPLLGETLPCQPQLPCDPRTAPARLRSREVSGTAALIDHRPRNKKSRTSPKKKTANDGIRGAAKLYIDWCVVYTYSQCFTLYVVFYVLSYTGRLHVASEVSAVVTLFHTSIRLPCVHTSWCYYVMIDAKL